MSLTRVANRLLSCPVLLISLLTFCVSTPSHVASGQVSCTPSSISSSEAKRLLKLVPEALAARRIGGQLSVVDWSPGNSYRTENFYFYELLSTKSTDTTPLDNGMLGYFGVNKQTGQVVELNSEKTAVEGTDLRRLQIRFRKEHCISEDLVAKDANLTIER
jgi:hypothetical protein